MFYDGSNRLSHNTYRKVSPFAAGAARRTGAVRVVLCGQPPPGPSRGSSACQHPFGCDRHPSDRDLQVEDQPAQDTALPAYLDA